jgi:Amt family ammonium transporter
VTVSAQLGKQAVGVITTIVYCGIGTWIILKIIDVIVGLRVVDEDEESGLDLALHDEQGYNLTT